MRVRTIFRGIGIRSGQRRLAVGDGVCNSDAPEIPREPVPSKLIIISDIFPSPFEN
jgi:hypothetical protein